MKIVVDLLGGDLGQVETVKGVKEFLKTHNDVEFILVGEKNKIDIPNVKIIDCNKAIKMDAHVMDILRDKESSMYKAVDILLQENADAIVSCGSTGGLLTLATLKIKKIPNVLRPALISLIPNLGKDHKKLLMDLGASNENSSDELIDFVKMGRAYYKVLTGNYPKFALLSNGKEKEKGSPLILETRKKIEELNIENFAGYVEGNDILKGDVDLIVGDGYSCNIAMKSIEGAGNIVKQLLKDTFKSNLFSIIAYLIVKRKLKKSMNMLSSKPLGGALFIGVNKVVIKAHGNSDSFAFKNAINIAYQSVKNDLISKIKEGLNGK